MLMSITFYWYPKCGTCQKAKKWLDENNVHYDDIHIVEHPPTKEQLQDFIKVSGLPMKKFFNTSGKKYRELNLKDKLPTMSDDEKLAVLASDGMLMKRPLTTDGTKVTVGFNEQQFEETWK